jgi:hypothetical protein
MALGQRSESGDFLTSMAGTHTTVEIAELFGVARSTVYLAIKSAGATA